MGLKVNGITPGKVDGIIASSLTGVPGQRYLYWRYLEVLGEVGAGSNNLVIAPTEGGIPIFFTPDR